jgi:hypothetical protein
MDLTPSQCKNDKDNVTSRKATLETEGPSNNYP